jgi:hypothetical protein
MCQRMFRILALRGPRLEQTVLELLPPRIQLCHYEKSVSLR